jgi:hypothetical protein
MLLLLNLRAPEVSGPAQPTVSRALFVAPETATVRVRAEDTRMFVPPDVTRMTVSSEGR